MPEYPLVTIVTPAYQMARFVADTIESVFAQDYPKIEYIVMDGGSTDGTLDVLRHYEGFDKRNIMFRWFSERDSGAADAINKGFARSHGAVFAYLNADDTYSNGAVSAAVEALLADSSVQGIYGDADWIREDGVVIDAYPTQPFDPELLRSECFICQPAAFIRRDAINDVGLFDISLRYAYDYEFWIRLSKRHRLRKINTRLATSRMHYGNKTIGERRGVLRENIKVLERHFNYVPFSHVLAYSAHLVDRRDQFFYPLRPSMGKYLLSLPIGLRFNFRNPLRYAREWGAVMSVEALRRRIRESPWQ